MGDRQKRPKNYSDQSQEFQKPSAPRVSYDEDSDVCVLSSSDSEDADPNKAQNSTSHPREHLLFGSISTKVSCHRCHDLFEYATQAASEPYPGTGTADIERWPLFPFLASRGRLIRSNCRLCQFLGAMGAFLREGGGDITTESLYTTIDQNLTSNFNTVPLFQIWTNSTYFSLLPSNATRKLLAPRLMDPTSVDYSLVKTWLEFCRNHHSPKCDYFEVRDIPGFKVIDCRAREIIHPGSGCRYTALSYVWGKSRDSLSPGHDTWPLTIEDSITVTLRLGFRYLWVDRYCIDQTDAGDRHTQIQNMDYIYARAGLTIIAAAGDGPHYGLPGVSSRCRNSQHSVSLGDGQLVQVFFDGARLRESSWSTRAWTIQEGFLSRRRLIFTDEQVSFLCNSMHCAESLSPNLEVPPYECIRGLRRPAAQPALGWPSAGLEDPHRVAIALVQLSCGADMSFDGDALNVCIGILRHLEVRHWFGVFIQRAMNTDIHTLNLGWQNDTPSHRRMDFPTWSWTSLTGRKQFSHHIKQSPQLCVIEIPLSNTQWVTVEEWVQSSGTVDALSDHPYLRITGALLQPQFVDRRRALKIKWWLEFDSPSTPSYKKKLFAIINLAYDDWEASVLTALQLDDVEDNLQTLFDAVALVWENGTLRVEESNPSKTFVQSLPVLIILKPTKDGYKRIGYTDASGGWQISKLKHNGVDQDLGNFWEHFMPLPLPPKTTFLLW